MESALDQARAAQAESAAARIGLSAAVAQAYFGWQADAARLALARERLQLAERGVLIAQRRLEAELDSGEDVQRAAQELAGVRDTVAMLEGSQQLRRVTLAALLGVSPDALPPLSARPLPTVDAALPGDLSLDLIARRPDVQASRWRVEAARASLRSVRAEYYPDVSLRALAGLSSLQIGELLQPGSAVPSLTAAVHLPLFDAGLRDARFGVGQAQVRAAVADYDSTVVDAAREVGGAVTRLTRAAARREQHQARGAAAGQLLRAADARVRAGTTDLRPRLEAERALLHEADALAQVELELLDADISLRQALGGGYDSRKQTPP